ncbi:MAG: EAL domain-containing protein [Lysinibacillus fusiformis]|uniref:EAL domain-containing protein n=1 Tax=Lysinibacillus fusiformis TaxID=28031 RepID=UPI0005004E8A|nr:EAL domain-containing protein [Lysinibacillus fusiformis]KGA84352.1 diguanylate cyclase [Lysinibacillus fusiformis]MCT6928029.1 EAL domain-containing protein [Lysinibacillus fusiformis]
METGMTLFESNRKSVLESIEHKKSFTLVYITIISWHDLDLSKCIDVVRRKLTLYQPKVEWYRVFDKEFLLVCHAQSQARLISQELSNIEYLKIHFLYVQDRKFPALNYVRQVYLQNTNSDERKECSSQKSLVTEEFEIVFQPILHHNRQLSFEALSRWRGEEMGSISPGICIPILNIVSLIELTKNIIKKAVDLLSRYNEIVYVSINLSASLIKDITWLIEHLDEIGITNNNRIAFEISEEIIMGIEASENLKIIRDRGHIIFIDGFGSGSGNSNFQYMSLLPLDGVKLDRLFISGKSNKKVMELLTNIIKALDLEVIIEGVDNVEQLNTLSEAQYDSIQGYYISRPLTINELTKFMNDNC